MSEHTPGPWLIDTETGVVVSRSDSLHVVASTFPHNRAANGRLIAAAPDMLAALERARVHMNCPTKELAAILVVEAAIAKAKGQP